VAVSVQVAPDATLCEQASVSASLLAAPIMVTEGEEAIADKPLAAVELLVTAKVFAPRGVAGAVTPVWVPP